MSDQQGAPLSRVVSHQYPSSHVGYLSQEQAGALDKFKVLCEQKGYFRPAKGGQKASHDDETLLCVHLHHYSLPPLTSFRRYLRARKFVPQDAFGQFKDTEDWRRDNRIDELYDTIDIHEYEETRRLVGGPPTGQLDNHSDMYSIRNGLAVETSVAYPSTSLKSRT